MNVERQNAKIHIENSKPLNDYDSALRRQKNRRPIYLDHCLAYVNSKEDVLPEVKRVVIKRLKSTPTNLFNDIYPKLDAMLTRASIELTRQKSNRVKKIAKNVEQQVEQITGAEIENIFDSLHEQQSDVVPETDSEDTAEMKNDPEDVVPEKVDERAAQEELDKNF